MVYSPEQYCVFQHSTQRGVPLNCSSCLRHYSMTRCRSLLRRVSDSVRYEAVLVWHPAPRDKSRYVLHHQVLRSRNPARGYNTRQERKHRNPEVSLASSTLVTLVVTQAFQPQIIPSNTTISASIRLSTKQLNPESQSQSRLDLLLYRSTPKIRSSSCPALTRVIPLLHLLAQRTQSPTPDPLPPCPVLPACQIDQHRLCLPSRTGASSIWRT